MRTQPRRRTRDDVRETLARALFDEDYATARKRANRDWNAEIHHVRRTLYRGKAERLLEALDRDADASAHVTVTANADSASLAWLVDGLPDSESVSLEADGIIPEPKRSRSIRLTVGLFRASIRDRLAGARETEEHRG